MGEEKLVLEKKCDFSFPKVFLITFFEGNSRADVEKNTSNDTFVCDDDAHIVVLCTCSPFFCTRWLLLRSKKTTLKINLTIKSKKKTQVQETSLRKNAKNTK